MVEDHLKKYATANPEIVSALVRLGIKGKKILDVGCWVGTLGSEVRSIEGCIFDGVDNNSETEKMAIQNGYREVFHINLNGDLDMSDIKQEYDVIVFGDVLEHTVNPDLVLTSFATKLKKDGHVIVSLPNIAFVTSRVRLLLGRWNYTEAGIMDKTHVRFFTLGSMKKLLTSNGFQINEYTGLNTILDQVYPLRRVGRFLGKVWPSLCAVQIIFVADKRLNDSR